MNVNSKRIVFRLFSFYCHDIGVLIVLLQNIGYFYHRLSIGFFLKFKGNGQSIKIRELYG